MKKLRYPVLIILVAIFALTAAGCSPLSLIGEMVESFNEGFREGYNEAMGEPTDDAGGAEAVPGPDASEEAPGPTQQAEEPAESAEPDEPGDGDEQARFDAYLEELTSYMVDADDFFTGYLFLDPGAAGLEGDEKPLGAVTEEEWRESCDLTRELIADLEGFDEDALNEESRLSLRIILDSLERSLLTEDYYYNMGSGLGLYGTVASIPSYIADYPVENLADLSQIFTLYSALPEAFEEYIALEKDCQAHGAGMTERSIELALEQYGGYLDPSVMISVMDEKIDGLDFMDSENKEENKKQNARLVEESFIPAYEYLVAELSAMQGRDSDYGAAGATDGADYYAAFVRELIGVDMTPEEIQAYLLEQYDYYWDEMVGLVNKPGVWEAYMEDDFRFTEETTAEGIIDYLQEAVLADYPDIGMVDYEVVLTPEALRTPGTIAYYVLRPLDQTGGEPANIYINDESTAADYITLAHEGFPGHMYQDSYAAWQGRPYARGVAGRMYTGFMEGWGTYSEIMAADYATTDADVARLYALDDLVSGILVGYADIGINYGGWSRDEFEDELSAYFDVEGYNLDYMFDMLAEDPAYMLAYNLGGPMLLELRRDAEDALDGGFDAVEFHRAVLDASPASFDVISDAVARYVAEAGGSVSAGSSGRSLANAQAAPYRWETAA